MALSKNPFVLLSIVNTKLLDFYSNLDELCDDLDEDKIEITNILESIGYVYNERNNQFIKK